MDQTTPFFIRRKSLPIWISGIAIFLIAVSLYGPYHEIKDEKEARSFLNTNAALLTTTLAVTMSFTILGIQFLAESYTPRAISGYLKDKVVFGFPVVYIALIALNLLSSGIPSILPPAKFVQYAIGGTIFSLIYLVAFIYYVIDKIQPESIIREISEGMESELWKEILKSHGIFDISSEKLKPFVILQQTMNKAVVNSDIFSFTDGLALSFNRLGNYLSEAEKEFEKNSSELKYIYGFFFILFSPLIAEAFKLGREQFVTQYQWHMFNQIEIIYRKRNRTAVNDFWAQLHYVGYKIFSLEMTSAAESYISQLYKLMKLELETVKRTRVAIQKDPLRSGYSDGEIVEWTLMSDFHYNRIKSLTEFGQIAASKRMPNIIDLILRSLGEIIMITMSFHDGTTRRRLLHPALECIRKIHEKCEDNGMRQHVWTTVSLVNYIKKINRAYKFESKLLVEVFCQLSLYSITTGYYFEIVQLGINGSGLVDDYPELTIIILDALQGCFKIIQNEPDTEMRVKQKETIVQQLKFIELSNTKKHKDITSRINIILTDYAR
jgi:hypothetical protein